MVWFDKTDGIVEIWDLAGGGDKPQKKVLAIPQNIPVAKLVHLVSSMFKHTVGTFGLLLKWGRNKVNLMNVRRDLTIADIGVDFSSETTYTLLIIEWPSSPSESDEATMPRVIGDGSSFLLDIMDVTRGFARFHLEIGPSTRVIDLFDHVVLSCNHEAGTFGLFLKSGWNKVELNDKDTRKLHELGVDLTSPSKVMLLVEVTSESPTNDADTENKASTTIEEKNTTVSACNSTLPANKDNAKERITTEPTITSEGDVPTVQNEDGDVKPSNTDSEKNPTVASEDDKTDICRRLRIAYPDLKPWVKSTTELNQEEDETDEPKARKKTWISRKTDSKTNRKTGELTMPEIADSKEVEFNRLGATGYVGLVNQAMTCYLNSLLQALYMTPEFRNALYNWEYVKDSEKDETKSIPYQLQKLFLNLQTSSKNAVETTSLTKSFGWDSTEAWQQHDIQELCRVMFDALEQKFKNTEQADLINRLYEGKMIDYVKCLECGTEKSREDTFLDIPLPVRAFGSNVAYGSVEEALAAFVQPETLDGTNQYHCDTCNKKCDAHKGLKFTKFPYFLTLHLKRFAFDYNTFHRIKLNDEVTFPDVLNLNSFIPSTASEDASDENSSVNAVKSDDGSTADSGNLDDDCPPCNNGLSANENSTSDNYEDEEDEGIERSNGPSTSSCNSHNHDDEKNDDNSPGPKGPYVYELFSIMIHSGSASGGHYYAYIKDFRTGKWLCFNDQNVSTITYDDIQKTYGGGPLRAYYSGVYSSSSNAYMLMYRQIDPNRNTLPMQVSDFPKHLQQLLIETQDSENNDMKNREMPLQMYRLKVFCHHPIKKTTVSGTLYAFHDNLWSGLTDRAYEAFDIHSVVDRDQVRLVTYQENTGLIDCSFQGKEHETLRTILSDQSDLLLEIRKKNETFKTYLSGGIARNVYVIDFTTKQVTKGPINVRGHLSQTIQEYKEQLALAIDMESKDINLFLSYTDLPSKHVTRNQRTLQEEDFGIAARVFVVYSSGADSTKTLEDVSEILHLLRNLIALNVQLPNLSKNQLRALRVPTLEEKRIQNATPLTNGPSKSPSVVEIPKDTEKTENNEKTPKSNEKDDVSTSLNKTTSPPAQMEIDDWHTPEQSNSEDSSLSYSDRTLVGEGDASEDEDYPPNIDHEVPNITNQDNNRIRDPSEYVFKVTRDEHEPDKLLRVLVDRRMALGTLKKVLEPHIGVPSEYFRVFRHPDGEMECVLLATKSYYDDGATIWIQLGVPLRDDEFKVTLYQLCLNSKTEPFKPLCEWTLSEESTVAQTKKEILAELKEKFDIDIPFERCRLRRKNYITAADVLCDDLKIKDIQFHERSFMGRELMIQELPDKETVEKPTDVVFFAQRISTMCVKKGPVQELVMTGKSMTELREKIVKLSGIPDEHLEITRGGDSLPDDGSLFMRRKRLVFYSQASTNDDCQPISIENGTIIYYRDSRELQLELNSAEVDDSHREATSVDDSYRRRTARAYGGVSSSKTSRYSPRRERGLKIYFDDM